MRSNMVENQNERLKEYFEVKVSEHEKSKLKDIARKHGMGIGAYVRQHLIKSGALTEEL